MIGWDARKVAEAAGAELARPRTDGADRGVGAGAGPGPVRAVIDSREARAGDLFVGLPGSTGNGGEHAPDALARGAWGVLVEPARARAALAAPEETAAVLTHAEPLRALQQLARAWRGQLRAQVVGITGSTGKTSTKDILAAIIRSPAAGARRTVASPENFNTEIGLPLAILEAAPDTEALVLEMAMRGAGQIAELAAIARPDVGLIVNIGPVHLEQLGSLEAVAAAKAELLAALEPGATAVVPADEPLLAPHRRADLRTITFGPGGEVELAGTGEDGEVTIRAGERTLTLRPSFAQAYNLRNLLAAVAAAEALGAHPSGPLEVRFSALRGDRAIRKRARRRRAGTYCYLIRDLLEFSRPRRRRLGAISRGLPAMPPWRGLCSIFRRRIEGVRSQDRARSAAFRVRGQHPVEPPFSESADQLDQVQAPWIAHPASAFRPNPYGAGWLISVRITASVSNRNIWSKNLRDLQTLPPRPG